MKIMFDSRAPRWRGLAVTAGLVAGLVLPACDSDSGSIPEVPRARIIVTVVPNPVPGVQNTLTGSVSAAYVVLIREIAGLGVTVNFVNSTVFDPLTGIQVASNYFDSADLKVFEGTDRIEPGGELNVAQTVSYALPDFRLDADLTVNVQALDDRGGLINQSVLARVLPPPL